MARYVIDAPTLLHVIDHDLAVDPAHQLVARNAIDPELSARAEGVVPAADVEALGRAS